VEVIVVNRVGVDKEEAGVDEDVGVINPHPRLMQMQALASAMRRTKDMIDFS